jgi:RNA polymerase sigma-70 factor (ECF subfamily)
MNPGNIVQIPGWPKPWILKSQPVEQTKEELFRHYFDVYFERLFIYAYTLIKDGTEAKDIAQASYIKLWEKRSNIDFTTSAKAFLYTTVYHLALNTNRNKKLRQRHQQNLSKNEITDTVYIPEQKEIMERIRKSIDELPPRCKEVFLKSRQEGKKYAEIAESLQVSEKTVEAQMGKALKYLREQLQDLILLAFILLTTI